MTRLIVPGRMDVRITMSAAVRAMNPRRIQAGGKGVTMAMRERERRLLRSIEDRLAGSDPPLAAMLAKFGRMTSGQAMPVRERIRAWRWLAPGGWRRAGRRRRLAMLLRYAGQLRLARGWQPAILVLVIFGGLLTVALVLGTSGHPA